MPFCHFSRVFAGMTLADLKNIYGIQEERKCKRMEYIELVLINVEQFEFTQICHDISKPQDCYQKYSLESNADFTGKWKCIVIENEQTKDRIILYTAGRISPLYAAIPE